MKTTHEKGDEGELRIAYEAIKRGYTVCFPFGHDARYDLVVDRKGTLERVQVKTTESNGKVITVRASSIGREDGRVVSKLYMDDEIDWLVIVDKTTDRCAYIPSSEFKGGKHSIALRYCASANNQAKRVRWFKDYEAW